MPVGTATGLGEDGYVQIGSESSWGDGGSGFVDFPVKSNSSIFTFQDAYERKDIVASRLKQTPVATVTRVGTTIGMDAAPSLMGKIFRNLLGTSADGTVSDSTYEHTWLMPVSGERIGKYFGLKFAKGADAPYWLKGLVMNKLKISSNNKDGVSMEFSAIGKNFVSTTRASSWSYPAYIPYIAQHVTVTIDPVTPANDSPITQLVNSFELEIDLSYDEQRFKIGGGGQISNPVFNGKPSVKLKMNVDADQYWESYAQTYEQFAVTLQILSTENAAGSTPFRTQIEIPKAMLKPDTAISNSDGRLSMDLEFDCSYGGSTTGSSSVAVMAEIRHRDAVASYS
jgi:hypothetical protein